MKRIKGLETLDSNGHGLVCTITRDEYDRLRSTVVEVHHVRHDTHEGVWD